MSTQSWYQIEMKCGGPDADAEGWVRNGQRHFTPQDLVYAARLYRAIGLKEGWPIRIVQIDHTEEFLEIEL